MTSSAGAATAAVLRDLGRELRRLRTDAGISVSEAATAMGHNADAILRFEAGDATAADLAESALRRLLELYRSADRADLLDFASQVRSDRWWTDFADVLSGPFRSLVIRERAADAILSYEPFVVPGLLQTARYVEAVVSGAVPSSVRTRMIDLRLRRQDVLASPQRLQFIVDEAALRHNLTQDDAAHIEQLSYLVQVSERPNVTLQVVPFRVHLDVGMRTAPFLILTFPDNTNDFLFLENPGPFRADLALDLDETGPRWPAQYTRRFFELEAAALSPQESKAFISGLIDG